jgi:hypothetical protein
VKPIAERPDIERSYGIPEDAEGMPSFDHVRDRMERCHTYWLTTVRPDGRSHAVPCLPGGSGAAEVHAVVELHTPDRTSHGIRRSSSNTESGEDVMIIEGTAVQVTDPHRQRAIDDAYEAKYGIRHGTPVWELSPAVMFAWTEYPEDRHALALPRRGMSAAGAEQPFGGRAPFLASFHNVRYGGLP